MNAEQVETNTTNPAADSPATPAPAALSRLELRDAERELAARRRQSRFDARLATAHAAHCAPCEHNVRHGWWGQMADGAETHCSKCHRGWSSYREAHCTVCCEHFVSTKAANRHRKHGVCVDPSTLTRRDGQPLFVQRVRTAGVTWALAFYGTLPTHWDRGSST
jgi:hypothetical protein